VSHKKGPPTGIGGPGLGAGHWGGKGAPWVSATLVESLIRVALRSRISDEDLEGNLAVRNVRAILTHKRPRFRRPLRNGLDCFRGNDVSAAKMDQAAAPRAL
jgi:hypothetical protein